MSSYCPICRTSIRKLPAGFWRVKKNRLHYLRCLARRLGYSQIADWYRITVNDFNENRGGSALTQIYCGSPQLAVQELYPSHDWKPWKFKSAGNGWWRCRNNRRLFVLSLQELLNIDDLNEWYQIPKSAFVEEGGRTLFKHVDGIVGALRETYPSHQWFEWLFRSGARRGFFRFRKNRLKYLRWLESRLGWQSSSDWLAISASTFRENYGGGILNSYYRNSPIDAAIELYPELGKRIHEFDNVPRHYWKKTENRQRAAEALALKLGLGTLDAWYTVRQADIRRAKFHGLLSYYNGSPYEMMKDLYPDHRWFPWRFGSVPNNWWKRKAHRLEALRYLGSELGFTTEADWYRIRASDFATHSLAGLLTTRYDNSPYLAVNELFPDYHFLPWMFDGTPHNYWKKRANRRKYIRWLGHELGFQCQDDWYQISVRDFETNYGWGMLHGYYGGRYREALIDLLPGFKWDPARFVDPYKKQQRNVYRHITKLFPDCRVHFDFPSRIQYPDTKRYCQFDIYVEELSLAIEYHGNTHYEPMPHINFSEDDLKARKEKDALRRKICAEAGIALIEIMDTAWHAARKKKREILFLKKAIQRSSNKQCKFPMPDRNLRNKSSRDR